MYVTKIFRIRVKCSWQSQLMAAILDLHSSPGSLSSPIQDGSGSQATLKKFAAHAFARVLTTQCTTRYGDVTIY